MDNIGIDLMHEEYQAKQKEAADEIEELHHHHETETLQAREPSPPPPSSSSTDSNSSRSAIHTEETVPVSSETEGVISRDSAAAGLGHLGGKDSVDSSSSSDFNRGSSGSSSGGISSLYQPGFTAPTINYDKEGVDQKLVAVIGREFDQPMDIARNLQDVLAEFENADLAKFVPFMVKRKTLLRGSFSTKDLGNHDLICLCYNASEARILLTGQDGFYTTLLKQIEALLGPNKVTFLISNYTAPLNARLENEDQPESNEDSLTNPNNPRPRLISSPLKVRLSHQEPLRIYLDREQVLSWSDEPERRHVERLLQLANAETNPQSFFAANACSLL